MHTQATPICKAPEIVKRIRGATSNKTEQRHLRPNRPGTQRFRLLAYRGRRRPVFVTEVHSSVAASIDTVVVIYSGIVGDH